MGFLQVLAATVGGYALGAVYYMTLSKPWLAATGLPLGPNGRPVGGDNGVRPFIIGFILGPMAETNLRRGLMLSDGDFGAFLSNPIAAVFLGLALVFILWQVVSSLRSKKSLVNEILRT